MEIAFPPFISGGIHVRRGAAWLTQVQLIGNYWDGRRGGRGRTRAGLGTS